MSGPVAWPHGNTTEPAPIGSGRLPRFTSMFGRRPAPGPGGSTNHQGIDEIGSYYNHAAYDGLIVRASYYGGWGLTVDLLGDDGVLYRYAHHAPASLLVALRQRVYRGQPLGRQGATGVATGVHVHFEVRPSSAVAVDPLPYIRKRNAETPVEGEEEEDEMSKNSAVMWPEGGKTLFAILNTGSGFWAQWTGLTVAQRNALAATFGTGTFGDVTASWANAFRNACAEVRTAQKVDVNVTLDVTEALIAAVAAALKEAGPGADEETIKRLLDDAINGIEVSTSVKAGG